MTPPELDPAEARALWRGATQQQELAARAAAVVAEARTAVLERHGELIESEVQRALALAPLERLREATSGQLRLGPLQRAGLGSVGQLRQLSIEQLEAIDGVGIATARVLTAAGDTFASLVRQGVRIRFDTEATPPAHTQLLRALARWEVIAPFARALPADLPAQAQWASGKLAAALPATRSALRRLFTRPARLAQARAALAGVSDWAAQTRTTGSAETAEALLAAVPPLAADPRPAAGALPAAPTSPPDPWPDFIARAATYYALLGTLIPTANAPVAGTLPASIARAVEEVSLDDSCLTVPLRGYQSFGARFVLAQRRVIIGDEMGLGKSLQALAAAGHLLADRERPDVTHALVVAPASVLVNWLREISEHTTLTGHRLHGEDREAALAEWTAAGGIGVTTFATLRSLEISPGLVDVLIVDEAHYVKNPATRRAKAVTELAQAAEFVVLLSGTPMENRLSEFTALTTMLRPELSARMASAEDSPISAFREAVAPVYLRRNQEDVLEELPDLLEALEWEEFGPVDGAAYRAAVAGGNFMAMRQAAFAGQTPPESAKLERLLELCQEANDAGERVVVFSFFRSVLQKATGALEQAGIPVYGPLDGSVPAQRRQEVVDDFSRHDAGVLVAQIEAVGVGLNIQAASVVILCEPQLKPSTEAQAIARAHRMGQVRRVQVHRLLTPDSVDERLREMLASKTTLFDSYLRDSALAAASPGAVDLTQVQLTRAIVAMEQARIAAGVEAVSSAQDAVRDAASSSGAGEQDQRGSAGAEGGSTGEA